MSRAREEEGFALVSAIIILSILIGLGIALLAFSDEQQTSATREQSREAAYSLAEGALNAQIFQLSQNWPQSQATEYPTSCTNSNASSYSNDCPSTTNLAAAYPSTGSTSCPASTTTDAWSPGTRNQWATYVRADGGGTSKLFSSSVDESQNAYDDGGSGGAPDGSLWVRAVGVANCRMVTLISKVSEQYVALNFPTDAMLANGFSTGNNGNKIIINTLGTAAQAGQVAVRCNGLTGGPPWPDPGSTCTDYRSGQVSPDTTTSAPANSGQTLTSFQLASLKTQAENNGTYWAAGSCPTSLSQLTGLPTYIEGPCNLSFSGNGSANSAGSPGFLVLVNGTIGFTGTPTFYGEIYAVNAQNSSGALVTTGGNATIQGAIDVDGSGTITIGDSGQNFVYDPTVFSLMKTWGGAIGTPNTFRELPNGQ